MIGGSRVRSDGAKAVRWESTLSERADSASAVAEVLASAAAGGRADVAFVFASAHHERAFRVIGDCVRDELADVVFGCSGAGVIGGGKEIEGSPGLSVLAGNLGGATATTLFVDDALAADVESDPSAWCDVLRLDPRDRPSFVLLADPYSCDVARLLPSLDAAYPDSVKVGGLAGSGDAAGHNALWTGQGLERSGATLLALRGALGLESVVAQGCRPVGAPMFVSAAEGNRIYGLDGRAPAEVLREIYESACPEDRGLLRQALFLGLVMRADRQCYGRGDFLVRNVLGLDAESGALVVGATVRDNDVVQVHVRDAACAAGDLEVALDGYRTCSRTEPPGFALLFSCLGRGRGLYGSSGHDSAALTRAVGTVPLGGFFCAGEIGMVGGTTFLHGYTSVYAMMQRRAFA